MVKKKRYKKVYVELEDYFESELIKFGVGISVFLFIVLGLSSMIVQPDLNFFELVGWFISLWLGPQIIGYIVHWIFADRYVRIKQ